MKEYVKNMKNYVKNMKEYVKNMKKYVKNMKEYVKNMKEYVKNMKEYMSIYWIGTPISIWASGLGKIPNSPPLYGPWDLEKF